MDPNRRSSTLNDRPKGFESAARGTAFSPSGRQEFSGHAMVDRSRKGRDADLVLSGGNRIPSVEIEELASRSSGPGGQHVNTSSTRVTLRWNLHTSLGLNSEARARLERRLRPRLSRAGVLIVHADRQRSRARNREVARERLRELVETALYQEPPRRPTRPTRASKSRRLDSKRHRGQVKTRRRYNEKDAD